MPVEIRSGNSPELPNLNRPQRPHQPAPETDRLHQAQTSAQKAAESTKVALVQGHQQRLVALSGALDKAEIRRTETLDRLSDRVAYLQDENLFMNDLLRLAQQKLKGTDSQPKQQTTVTALDALVDAFDEIGEWELPAIAPTSAMGGALPASY